MEPNSRPILTVWFNGAQARDALEGSLGKGLNEVVGVRNPADWWGGPQYGQDPGFELSVVLRSSADAMGLRNEIVAWSKAHGLVPEFETVRDVEPNSLPREPIAVEQCDGCGDEVVVWSKRQLTPEGDALCPRCRRGYTRDTKERRRGEAAEQERSVEERRERHASLRDEGVCGGGKLRFDDPELAHEPMTSPTGKTYCRVCLDELPGGTDEIDVEAIDSVEPNRRGLGDRPSMKTRLGSDLDPDALDGLTGRKGRDVDGAMGRYETFHAKKPIRVTELTHDLPTSWVCVGDGLAVMYRTDKWKKDGTDEDYKHLHDAGDDKPYAVRKGVRFYEPAGRGQRGVKLPAPAAITLLGYCLGAFVRKDDDGQEYETNPRGCYLFSAPDGHTLYIYSPDKQDDGSSGFMAALHGGKLRVLKDGIDG